MLGKPGEYKNDESPVIRKWRVIASSESGVLPADDATWLPAYSKVSGELPVEAFPDGKSLFARGFVNVLVAGTAQLEINSGDGLTLWVDGKRVDDPTAPIKLEKGRHTVTFGFIPKERKNGLRVELKAVDDESRLQPEGGF